MFSPESSVSIPESPPTIAFDQAIRDRMDDLGLDLAALNRRYCDYLRSQGDLKASPNNRRRTLVALIQGEADPTLKTALTVIHPHVLNGEMLVSWSNQDNLTVIEHSESIAEIIRQRMIFLGRDPDLPSEMTRLTSEYCKVKFSGEEVPVKNHVRLIKSLVGQDPNSRMHNISIVIGVLGGKVYLRWKTKRTEHLASSNLLKVVDRIDSVRAIKLELEEIGEMQTVQFANDAN